MRKLVYERLCDRCGKSKELKTPKFEGWGVVSVSGQLGKKGAVKTAKFDYCKDCFKQFYESHEARQKAVSLNHLGGIQPHEQPEPPTAES